MNTVAHQELHNLWGGKVIIDEVRQFKDSRGMLSELWRTDDEKNTSSTMSYWSVTNPLTMRGPHEHKAQCDFFISWFSKMVYQLYNPQTKEIFHFITDPNKVYRVKVDVGIIHSYRNLELKPSTTGNFPTALFMGKDKKSPIDEIRHEDKIGEDLTTYVILGANGRLGKSITNYLFKNMGYHKYHVIPIYEKITASNIDDFINTLFNKDNKICIPENTNIINCAGLTNVQKLEYYTDEVKWANVTLPHALASHSHQHDAKFYHISSDYVFRENDSSVYTRSKKEAENILKEQNRDAKIIRVANLFSLDSADTHNLISKLKLKAQANETITADANQLVFPTDVDLLAKEIINFVDNGEVDEINICGKEISLIDLFKKMNGVNVRKILSPIKFNSNQFLKDAIKIDCDDQISNKIKQ